MEGDGVVGSVRVFGCVIRGMGERISVFGFQSSSVKERRCIASAQKYMLALPSVLYLSISFYSFTRARSGRKRMKAKDQLRSIIRTNLERRYKRSIVAPSSWSMRQKLHEAKLKLRLFFSWISILL